MLAGLARVVTKNIGRQGRRKLGGLAGIQDLINSGVTSGLTSGVFTLAATGDPTQALAYGVADAVGSTAAMGGLRRMRGTKREMIYKKDPKTGKMIGENRINPGMGDTIANVTGSALSTIPVTLALSPAEQGQQVQIQQQQLQRSAVNGQSPQQLAGKYYTDTMLQSVEGPSPRAQQVQANNSYFDQSVASAQMAQIMGIE